MATPDVGPFFAPGSLLPSNPAPGYTWWFDPATSTMRVWNGSAYVSASVDAATGSTQPVQLGQISSLAAPISGSSFYAPPSGSPNYAPASGSPVYVASSALSGSTGAISVGYSQGGSGSVLRTVTSKLQETVSVKDFGAKGDGVTNDSAAVAAAHAYAQSVGYSLHFPHGTYILTSAFTLYINETSWIGDNATLDFTGLTGTGYALTLDSTSSYANQAQQVRYALQGIKLHGGTSTSRGTASGIFIGNSAGNAYVSCFSLDTFVVEGFATNISFGSNVWKLRMSNGIVRWGAMTVPSGLSNFGENMVCDNIFFADTDTFTPVPIIQSGEWHFNNCSLDNYEIDISNGVNVYFNGSHFEKPGLAGAVVNSYLRLTGGQNTTVRVSDSLVVGYYSSITKAPFYIDDTITSGGLYFNGTVFPYSANINLSNETRTDKLLFEDMFVCGKGRATFTDCRTTFISSASNYAGCSTSYNANLVDNGNMVSAVVPFTQQFGATQTAPTVTADVSSPTGYVCTIPMTTVSTTCGWRTNKISVVPGQAVSSLIVGLLGGLLSGDSAAFNMIFEDSAGNSIAPTPLLYQATTANVTSFQTLYPNSTVAPPGASVVYIQLQITTGSSTGTRNWYVGAVSITVL